MWKCILCIVVFALMTQGCSAKSTLVWGIERFRLSTSASRYAELAAHIERELNASVTINVIATQADFTTAILNGSLDFILAGPGWSACLQAETQIIPLATTVTNSSNVATSLLAGIIFTHINNTHINVVKDVVGQTVVTGPYSRLADFQAQWAYLKQSGIDLFVDTKGVYISPDTETAIYEVDSGEFTIGIGVTGQIERLGAEGKIRAGNFKILDPKSYPGFPYTTTTELLPGIQLSTTSNLDQETGSRLLSAFQRIPADVVASTGIIGVVQPFNVFSTFRLQAYVGTQKQPFTRCSTLSEVTMEIICPSGYERQSTICPNCAQNHTCLCNPCRRVSKTVGHLSRRDFILTLLLPSLAIVVSLLWIYRIRSIQISCIPYQDLILSGSRHITSLETGPVCSATYRGLSVLVSPVVPDSRFGLHRFGIRNNVLKARLSVKKRSEIQCDELVPSLGLCRPGTKTLQVFLCEAPSTLQNIVMNPCVPLDLSMCLSFLIDIAEGLTQLHECGEYGTDFRTNTIMVDARCRAALLADLTHKRSVHPEQAPEILNGGDFTESSDVYAFGMCAYEITHRRECFVDDDADDLIKAVKDTQVVDRHQRRPDITRVYDCEVLYDVIQDCWKADPARRPALIEILSTLVQLRAQESLQYQVPFFEPLHVGADNAAFLYAQGSNTGLGFLFEQAPILNVISIPCNDTDAFTAMAQDVDGCIRLANLAVQAIQLDARLTVAIHVGRLTRCRMLFENTPVVSVVGPAPPLTKILQRHGKPGAIIVSSAVVDLILADQVAVYTYKFVLQRRPGFIQHRGYPDTACHWLTGATGASTNT